MIAIGQWADGPVTPVFFGCADITSVAIPDSVTSITGDTFLGCTGLTSITVAEDNPQYSSQDGILFDKAAQVLLAYPGGKKGAYSIPDSVTSIGYCAFDRCTGLTSVTIPGSVTSIGYYAFSGCTGLTSITAAADNSQYSSQDGVLFDKAAQVLLAYPGGKKGAYSIPSSVTSIGEEAFEDCAGLTSVTIPGSVTSIGRSAFDRCTGLTSVTIPSSVTEIGYYSYSDSYRFGGAFSDCTGLISATIQSSVIGEAMFSGCSSLTSVTIENDVTSIVYRAFEGCAGLRSVTILDSASIAWQAFYNCTEMTDFTVSAGNPQYSSQDGVLFDKGAQVLLVCPKGKKGAYSIPSSVTSIRDSAFYGCTRLTSVTIPGSVTSIGGWAFAKCTGLTSVTIPDSVTSIGSSAFYGCAGLTSVTIPGSVTSIGDSAFKDCAGLRSVTIPDSVTSIRDSAFSGCAGLTSITIPGSVTSIGGWAFAGCTGLTSVTIENGVRSIGGEAFKDCAGLRSVTIPDSVTSIGTDAFEGTAWYNSQTDGVVYAGKTAYKYKGVMPKNTTITLQNGTVSIMGFAFWYCTGLTSVMFKGSNTTISPGTSKIFPGIWWSSAFPNLRSLLSAGGAEEKNGYKMAAGTYTLSGGVWTKR
ncbi:MAG: leucine-rich repeat domain-containing protein [Treponematales bacterium]